MSPGALKFGSFSKFSFIKFSSSAWAALKRLTVEYLCLEALTFACASAIKGIQSFGTQCSSTGLTATKPLSVDCQCDENM